jgi:RimJ/RimL family protein N-acetyltransferase
VTERPGIRLERLAERHVADLEALVHDPDVLRFTRVPDPPPDGFSASWIGRYVAGQHDGGCAGFAAFAGDGEFVGVGVAPTINPEGRELELGYVIAPAARGRGYGSALLHALTTWAFIEVRALRIYLIVDVENVASVRVAERAGYTREGVLRSAWVKQQQRADTAIFSLLPGDPRPD